MKKLTYSFVKNEIEKEGYIIFSSEYINNYSLLKCACPNGHMFEISWRSWKKRSPNLTKCSICNKLQISSSIKKSRYELLKKEFEEEGYELVTTEKEYKNQRTKLHFVCPKGHNYFITETSWKKGCRCYYCNGNLKYDISAIRKLFSEEGYTLLSNIYVNSKRKLEYICNRGHLDKITWNSWHKGSRCFKCGVESRTKKSIKDFSVIKKSFEDENYILLSSENDYKNAANKLDYICSKGHKNSIRWSSWQQGVRCASCSHITSNSEMEILSFLKNHDKFIDTHNRTIISPLELDIFIPDKKVSVEYCGLYWHSESNGKDKNYHLNKLNKCNERGIRLITIFEDEWIHRQDIVKSMLLNKLGFYTSGRIYAKDCEVREIEHNTKNEFLDKYHIQGKDKSFIKLGAFYEDRLVSVMTFAKLNIAKGAYQNSDIIELSRFCSDSNYIIVGIASKLLKYFIKNYTDCKKIISYADRRWSDGDLYKKLGFEFVHNTAPNYWYVDKHNRKRIHRFNFRKSVLSKKLDNYDPNLTERENMKLNGYDRIWDCGNIKFEFRR